VASNFTLYKAVLVH